MKNLKKYGEKIVEGLLFTSSTVTSITVILIFIFLFREGTALFQNKPVEKGYAFILNSDNPVKKLSAKQLKDIFNQDIVNWKDVGGMNDSIVPFTLSDLPFYFTDEEMGTGYNKLPALIGDLIRDHRGIIAYIPEKYIPVNYQGFILDVKKISLKEFLFGKEWYPTSEPVPLFGAWPLITGTLLVTLGAILIALPLGLATAIFLSEVIGPRWRNTLKPVIELLAGIPSVVYGFFGLVVLVPLIQQIFHLEVGETVLAGSIILGIMALPTIVTISEDALYSTPRSLKDASFALGATHWQTIRRVSLPHARSGIIAAFILGIGRAIGETMAVLMVTGNAAIVPHSFLVPARTIPATIAAELGESPYGGLHFQALFALGSLLFLFTLAVNITIGIIRDRGKIRISGS